jgi:hypothetical protein
MTLLAAFIVGAYTGNPFRHYKTVLVKHNRDWKMRLTVDQSAPVPVRLYSTTAGASTQL